VYTFGLLARRMACTVPGLVHFHDTTHFLGDNRHYDDFENLGSLEILSSKCWQRA